jgi:hypothetical protein
MKLMTKELLNEFEKIGSQENVEDPIIICKFFNPQGVGTWYMTEYNPDTEIFYGYVTGLQEDEWGYTSLKELESFKGPFKLGIERDLHFKSSPISWFTN